MQQQPNAPITFQKYSDYIKNTKPKHTKPQRTQQYGTTRHIAYRTTNRKPTHG